ncbi:uncharacterized protein PV09_01037 [Verruconis gallopava]|uniref:Uncharacterized protein n=1 Tax=Verruconis gallopava TaxID=253628 RepID=A0A0D2BA13_9PEZI|nr:uncharacterized protein PV09_01037 [Verruconis gallopava]KIW08099.1 hypothetical protein PV09_01037 [Verruconis gallopava]
MATALETSHVIAAVLSVFHNAADLTKQISKKSKKKKSEHALRLKWLLETLESGEVQISQRYSQYLQELGERFRLGDDRSRDRIQHVAIIMQAELLRSLQLGAQFDNAEVDAGKLQDDAAFFRRDVLSALDELRSRVLDQSSSYPAMYPQMATLNQHSSAPSPTTPRTPPIDFFPSGVNIPPAAEDEGHGRMSRLFSIRSRPYKRSSNASTTIQNIAGTQNLSWSGSAQAETEKFELAADDVQRQQEPSTGYQDIKAPIPEPDTEMLHPALSKQTSIARHPSTSTHSSDFSNYTRSSAFSDEKIPVLQENDEAFPEASTIAAALPPTFSSLSIHSRANHERMPSASSQFGTTRMSPTESLPPNSAVAPSPTRLTPDYSPQLRLFPVVSQRTPSPTNLPVPARDRSNTTSSGTSSSIQSVFARSASVTSTPSSVNTVQLVGRPEKKNNYWGFCKGAWTIREDWQKGLAIQAIPAGMFAQDHVWQCKHCCFRGSIFGAKKPYKTDPNVHTNAETGVRYRWIFLAKSHTKVPLASTRRDAGFGCLFCSLNNTHSSVYGSEALLFKHVVEEHVPGMTDSLAKRANCILGRKAEVTEDFDINIP